MHWSIGFTDVRPASRAQLNRIRQAKAADGELLARSRSAVSQSFAILTRVPDLSFTGRPTNPLLVDPSRPATEPEAHWSSRAWAGFDAQSDLRYFFDVTDGGALRRDETGMVLASEDDVSRETKLLLFDLAQAAIPEGRPRLFVACVRNQIGKCVYEGSMRMKPLPSK